MVVPFSQYLILFQIRSARLFQPERNFMNCLVSMLRLTATSLFVQRFWFLLRCCGSVRTVIGCVISLTTIVGRGFLTQVPEKPIIHATWPRLIYSSRLRGAFATGSNSPRRSKYYRLLPEKQNADGVQGIFPAVWRV